MQRRGISILEVITAGVLLAAVMGVSAQMLVGVATQRRAAWRRQVAVQEASNQMELFHCGSAAVALSDPRAGVSYRTHCKPGNHRPGVTAEFPVRAARASFLKLDMLDGACRVFFFQGDTAAPARHLRGCQATVMTDAPVRPLIESLLDHGVSHHLVLSLGDVAQRAACFAQLAGLPLVAL